MSKVQKLLFLTTLFLTMLSVNACANEKVNATQEKADSIVAGQEDSEYGQIISISMAEMEEKKEEGEPFLVSFVTIDCPYCQEFHSMLADYVLDHPITMYQVILDYEETTEEENREKIASYFPEFHTIPGVFYVMGEEHEYLDTYHLGVGEDAFDEWVEENHIGN